jgi:hypothetical protein
LLVAAVPGVGYHRALKNTAGQQAPWIHNLTVNACIGVRDGCGMKYLINADGHAQFSFAAHATRLCLGRRVQVFMVSWRKPTAARRDWDLTPNLIAMEEALDAVSAITGSPDTNLTGVLGPGPLAGVAHQDRHRQRAVGPGQPCGPRRTGLPPSVSTSVRRAADRQEVRDWTRTGHDPGRLCQSNVGMA